MPFNESLADWAGLLARQSQSTERARFLVDQLCSGKQVGLTDTMTLALAMMAVEESEQLRLHAYCDFEDLLALAARESGPEPAHQTL
jgi:hypothetical protein